MNQDPSKLGPRARAFVETWAPRVRILSRTLDVAVVLLVVACLAGVTSWRVLIAVVILRLVPPGVYGWIAAKKMVADARSP